jgi:hypothetical protein
VHVTAVNVDLEAASQGLQDLRRDHLLDDVGGTARAEAAGALHLRVVAGLGFSICGCRKNCTIGAVFGTPGYPVDMQTDKTSESCEAPQTFPKTSQECAARPSRINRCAPDSRGMPHATGLPDEIVAPAEAPTTGAQASQNHAFADTVIPCV